MRSREFLQLSGDYWNFRKNFRQPIICPQVQFLTIKTIFLQKTSPCRPCSSKLGTNWLPNANQECAIQVAILFLEYFGPLKVSEKRFFLPEIVEKLISFQRCTSFAVYHRKMERAAEHIASKLIISAQQHILWKLSPQLKLEQKLFFFPENLWRCCEGDVSQASTSRQKLCLNLFGHNSSSNKISLQQFIFLASFSFEKIVQNSFALM